MKRTEALKILGLPDTATDEEAKKKFRELSRLYHPDINKEPGNEEHFKKISSAFTAIQNPEPEPEQPQHHDFHTSINLEDMLRNFQSGIHFGVRPSRPVKQVKITVPISFDESIKGCQKEVTIDRDEACSSCRGIGATFIPKSTPCPTCNDKGKIETQQGNTKFIRACPNCLGHNKIKIDCKACNGKAVKSATRVCKIEIPEGVVTGNLLRLSRMGNFVPSGMGSNYLDAFVELNVTPRKNMSLVGNDVVSTIEVTLLDCLQGVKRKEQTVYGEVEVQIPPNTKNKDEVLITGHGVRSANGNHKFTIFTKYPDTNKLVEFLKKLEN